MAVSRETTRPGLSLPDAEFPEDDVEEVFDIDPADQPAQRKGRPAEFLSGQFLAPPDHVDAAAKRPDCLLQQLALPCAADQASLAGPEIVVREADQGGDQFRNPIAAGGRDPELRMPASLALLRTVEVDLVAHQPDRRRTFMSHLPLGGIGQPQYEIRLCGTGAGAPHPLLFDWVLGLANARS